jgi:hypothetical protein
MLGPNPESVLPDQILFSRKLMFETAILPCRALHGAPMGPRLKNRNPMGPHGAPLEKLQISLFKPNSQRQDAYHLKASLFLH